MTEREAEKLLRGASLRVTRPRLAVLAVIHEVPHQDAGTIVGLVRERLGGVSTQAVYGVLNCLVEKDLARRIDPPGSAALYESRKDDGHQHVICRSCGRITDVDGPGREVLTAPLADRGFVVEEVEVTYRGICPPCLAAEALPAAGAA